MLHDDCSPVAHIGCNQCDCRCHGDMDNILIRDTDDGYILAKLIGSKDINDTHKILIFGQKEYFYDLESAMNAIKS